ncbi:MAG: YceI family protein [Haliscomenobacter sp.]|nr:YceI family protein [Haliscomenobacter sp.]MBK9491869.1 YceI family protein [Haliscomenobacter sp.]
MYKTLKGDEYPEIRIELLQVKQLSESKPGAWSIQLVEAALTIAGVRKTIELSVRAQQTDPDRFRFVSDKNILMTEFGLIPPKALMGTIKVNDLIRIHMDLIVGVERECKEVLSSRFEGRAKTNLEPNPEPTSCYSSALLL